jgi:hypothetical protein
MDVRLSGGRSGRRLGAAGRDLPDGGIIDSSSTPSGSGASTVRLRLRGVVRLMLARDSA